MGPVPGQALDRSSRPGPGAGAEWSPHSLTDCPDDRVEVRGDGVVHRGCRGGADGARRRVVGACSSRGELIAAAEGAGLPGTLKSELFASALELNTGVCASAAEGAATLAELRRGAARLAEERGFGSRLQAATRSARPRSRRSRTSPRYASSSSTRASRRGGRASAACTSTSGCRAPKRVSDALEGVLPWLPVVLAWSANSPYLSGELRRGWSPTGRRSSRSSRARSAAGFPLVRGVGGVRGALHPPRRSPTTTRGSGGTSGRIRASAPSRSGCPTSRRSSRARSASSPFSKGLCDAVARAAGAVPFDPAGRGMYQQNRWAASRFGLAAELVHPDGDRTARASELAIELPPWPASTESRPDAHGGRPPARGGASRGPRSRLRRPRRAHAKLEAWPS